MHICHYLSQWWPRHTSPNGCIRLQWAPGHNGLKFTETLGKSGTLTKDHCSDVKMSTTASQIIAVSIVCSVVVSGAHQWNRQSSASPAFVRETHCWPVDFPHKGARNAKNTSIWWRHHIINGYVAFLKPTLVLTKTRLNKNKILLSISTAWTIINKYFPWKNRVCSGFNALTLYRPLFGQMFNKQIATPAMMKLQYRAHFIGQRI